MCLTGLSVLLLKRAILALWNLITQFSGRFMKDARFKTAFIPPIIIQLRQNTNIYPISGIPCTGNLICIPERMAKRRLNFSLPTNPLIMKLLWKAFRLMAKQAILLLHSELNNQAFSGNIFIPLSYSK